MEKNKQRQQTKMVGRVRKINSDKKARRKREKREKEVYREGGRERKRVKKVWRQMQYRYVKEKKIDVRQID